MTIKSEEKNRKEKNVSSVNNFACYDFSADCACICENDFSIFCRSFFTWHSYFGFSIVAAVLADVVADVGLCFDGDVADGVGGRCGHISVSISAMH